MATVKFNLRKKSSTKPESIFLIFRHQKEKLSYSTGSKVLPKYWNFETCRIRNVTQVLDRDKINNHLNELETEVLNYTADLVKEKKTITKNLVKRHLDVFTGHKIGIGTTLFDFIEKYIHNSKTRTNPDTGKFVHARTIQKYRSTLNLLREFDKSFCRHLDFNSIDHDFYQDFVSFMQERKYSVNTIGKHIQVLKTFLNAATHLGVNKNQTYKNRFFKVVKEESEHVYLTESELNKIYQYDLSGNGRLIRVRDLFIIACWTGLRFSDFTHIKPENIKGDFFHMEQYKTGGKVVIPIHPTVRSILDKYDGRLPQNISNQKMNDYIKEICLLAGLTEYVQKGITKGGIRVIKRFEKWELVSTHTARRSFATNLYKSGFPSISIMQITGHKTEAAFLKYIRVTPDEHAQLLKMHWEKHSSPLKVVK